MKKTPPIAEGFRNVDGQLDFERYRSVLTYMNGIPSFRLYKEQLVDWIDFGKDLRILDLACGLGLDFETILNKMNKRSVLYGIDSSRKFLDLVDRRTPSSAKEAMKLISADAAHLPIEDEFFDYVRIERSLQHMHNPLQILSEVKRVTAKHGRILLAEPDWSSFQYFGMKQSLGKKLQNLWTQRIKNPTCGSDIKSWSKKTGLSIQEYKIYPLSCLGVFECDLVFDLLKVMNELKIKKSEIQQILSSEISANLNIHLYVLEKK